MIVVKNKEGSEDTFNQILDGTRKLIIKNFSDQSLKNNITPETFEQYVCEQMRITAKGSEFDGVIEQTANAAFPDIVANGYFGVEVKMTSGDKWESTGNSVLESSRVKGVERIYMFFGKFGGIFDIAYRNYADCLFDVAVTHYPRYKINMKLADGQSIFHKIKIDYDTFRKDPNSIKRIKDYYRAQLKAGEELWWIDQQSDGNSVSPIIKNYSNLDKEIKENIKIECMSLFPEIYSDSSLKYQRAAVYLVVKFNVVSSSFRDWFSAGGQVKIKIDEQKSVKIPKKYYKLFCSANAIKNKIQLIDGETLRHYWKVASLNKDRIGQFKKMIDEASGWKSGTHKLSDVFEAGFNYAD